MKAKLNTKDFIILSEEKNIKNLIPFKIQRLLISAWDYLDKEQIADRKAYTKEEQEEIFNEIIKQINYENN